LGDPSAIIDKAEIKVLTLATELMHYIADIISVIMDKNNYLKFKNVLNSTGGII
jgi:hypothetical protein